MRKYLVKGLKALSDGHDNLSSVARMTNVPLVMVSGDVISDTKFNVTTVGGPQKIKDAFRALATDGDLLRLMGDVVNEKMKEMIRNEG